MQTQQIQQTDTDAESGELRSARVELRRLTEAAVDAEAEAERWRIAFEHEPTAQSHSGLVVSQQRALNARAAAYASERDLARLVSEHENRERNQIAAVLEADAERATLAITDAFGTIVQGIGELDGAIAELGKLHHSRVEAQAKQVPLRRLSLGAILASLNDEISSLRGAAHDIPQRVAHVALAQEMGRECHVVLEFHRPAVIATPLR